MFDADLGEFDADVCDECGETFLDSESMETLEARAKKVGVWGLGEKRKVVKSGNSLVIRIPARLSKHLKLKSGTRSTSIPRATTGLSSTSIPDALLKPRRHNA